MTYFANFKANNGTSLQKPIVDTNKRRIIKGIRNIAESERFIGNECSWVVWYKEDGNSQIVAEGGMTRNGTRYRLYDF